MNKEPVILNKLVRGRASIVVIHILFHLLETQTVMTSAESLYEFMSANYNWHLIWPLATEDQKRTTSIHWGCFHLQNDFRWFVSAVPVRLKTDFSELT